ncbi:MAG: uncharacterized protein QOF37_2348 [Thermoleophilaceae bacterium]|nr:uncharacterized protein [Thermoleophilaceae bacterium]
MQSGTGIGFALVAAPILTAVYGPVASVATLALLGPVVSSLTVAGEGRRPRVLTRTAVLLSAAAVPGMAAGVLVLRHAPVNVLRILVALAVLGGVVAIARGVRGSSSPLASGFLSGLLSTSTGLNGPPLVLYLLHRGAEPEEVRDTLAAVFLATGVLTIATLALAGTLEPAPNLLLLILATVVGQLLGRRLFERIHARHREATLAVLVASALMALVPAAQALL